MSRTVALDFDGTLHPYTAGWTGSEPEDEPPVPGAVEFVRGLFESGYQCVVFSCRADHDQGYNGIVDWLRKWLGHEVAGQLRVTHVKPAAVAYVDDRAVEFRTDEANWDECRARIDALAQGRAHGVVGA